MSEKSAVRFLASQREAFEADSTPTPCEHGHHDCSNVPGGACLDEVLSIFPHLAD